ncbi:MAG: hypothetical protein RQ966_15670 [Acetobacteraceae bacterium]|nr:hypothetical protein [Acetobacteraceae bacterium]
MSAMKIVAITLAVAFSAVSAQAAPHAKTHKTMHSRMHSVSHKTTGHTGSAGVTNADRSADQLNEQSLTRAQGTR